MTLPAILDIDLPPSGIPAGKAKKRRPDGFFYVEWTWVANQLDELFGVGQWRVLILDEKAVPVRKARRDGHESSDCTEVVVKASIDVYINGQWHSFGHAYGGHIYDPSNRNAMYAYSLESAKQEAFKKVAATAFRIARDLWHREETRSVQATEATMHTQQTHTGVCPTHNSRVNKGNVWGCSKCEWVIPK